MANPTTNYGWPMPTSTDLVTDLPADFAAFGQPVDTSLKALNPETTLGDIAYRSATANTNTRLAIGTTGQVLSVSSGVPAWTTPAAAASGMTFISRTAFSAVSSQIFDSVFSSTYETYLIVAENIYSSTGGNDIQFQWRYGSTTEASAYYGSTTKFTSSANFVQSSNTAEFTLAEQAGTSTQPGSFSAWVTNAGQTSQYPLIHGTGIEGQTPGGVFIFGCFEFNARTYTGFLLKPSAGTMTGEVSIYGLAKA
jgi:hypothetical protein